jgi:hypothetical protein
VADRDPGTPGIQPSCQGTLKVPTATGYTGYRQVPIPTCQPGGERPCLEFVAEPLCPGSGLRTFIDNGDQPPAPGTQVALKCTATADVGPPGSAPPACLTRTCPPRKALGQTCVLDVPAMSMQQAFFRTDAPECASGLCLKPALQQGVAANARTGPTCSRTCQVDADCADAEFRDPSLGSDTRCKAGYSCAVPFEVGALCCRKLCVCRDFVPKEGMPVPASCDPALPASVSQCSDRH